MALKHKNEVTPRKLVVDPVARRDGGTNSSCEESGPYSLSQFMKCEDSRTSLETISDRLASYARETAGRLEKLRSAVTRSEVEAIESSAQHLANICADVGALRMMKLSYQIILTAKAGHDAKMNELFKELDVEFDKVRSNLRVAI